MVSQGDIIRVNFSPQSGHEQAGDRPALVISNNAYNSYMGKAIVCPITTTDKDYPFQVRLDEQTVTVGVVMCEQLKALDIRSGGFKFVEKASKNILERCSALCRSMLAIE